MSEILEQIQDDTKAAMKAGERAKVATLRMLASALQQDAKLGEDDALAVLRRERKKRIEAADAYADANRAEQEKAERAEAELIDAYLPAQLSEAELEQLVAAAIAESGASSMAEIGKVIGVAMAKANGRADGKRVSVAVRDQLGA